MNLIDVMRETPMNRERYYGERNSRFFFKGVDLSFLTKDSKILEIGCGSGKIVEGFSKKYNGKPYGIDIVGNPKSPINLTCANGESLPFKDNTFDLVFSYMANRYIGDKLKGIEECHRVVKPEGLVLIDFMQGDDIQIHKLVQSPNIYEVISSTVHQEQLTLEEIYLPGSIEDFEAECLRLKIKKIRDLEFPFVFSGASYDKLCNLTRTEYRKSFI